MQVEACNPEILHRPKGLHSIVPCSQLSKQTCSETGYEQDTMQQNAMQEHGGSLAAQEVCHRTGCPDGV